MNTFETIQLDNELTLQRDENGLFLSSGDQILRGDFTKMIPRVKGSNISKEFLVKAAKIKDADHELRAVDATAGLGEDSLLLAAAGFQVTLFERNPVIAQLLADALERAKEIPELAPIVARMTLRNEDSIEAM
ncbi:MAG: class I SAM-dependent methyltransferase, partial [Firmicutes bacterium]|nr:class I SAM-dependent methyltransferase [Bacillota bacterium]